ncbi:phospholipase D family protein [Nocardioides sp. C4-1]|uniref:phospholipase D-like domain-containing protein n=1 Tax=Nocardioides sp. C4-1 TaxID=3151851 RepID=UPI00326604FD
MTEPAQWLLTRAERGNPATRIDDTCAPGEAWSTGNLAEPLVDGEAYFARLLACIEATGPGDLVWFTDWQGDARQRLGEADGTDVLTVLVEARRRGVDVRGLVWRSHTDLIGFFAAQNRRLGEQLGRRGVPVQLDMRVRPSGSHHQKFVVVRHRDRPADDVAFLGGIDLAHNRRDSPAHHGDPQGRPLTPEYGEHAPWHDVQLELRGPVVHGVETVFRERWEDPTPLTRLPWRRVADALRPVETEDSRLPDQQPPPPTAGSHTVQLLRTYPALRAGRAHPFAPQGERSVGRGYRKAIARAERFVYVEDQYFWGDEVADLFAEELAAKPELRLMIVLPRHPDKTGLNRAAQLLARGRAIDSLHRTAPGRVAAFTLENTASVPVYVHAKVTIVDDEWASTGSDNFNRRSWTHDSELTAAVIDTAYARRLRLQLAAEHLGRLDPSAVDAAPSLVADCDDGADMFTTFGEAADRLDAWHRGGRHGSRPPGHLRRLPRDPQHDLLRPAASLVLELVHNPDGRPRRMRGTRQL